MALYSRFACGDISLGFELADDGPEMRLVMVPASRDEVLDCLDGTSGPPTAREQLVQVALAGETGPGNRSLGRSMMHGSTTAALRFVDQQVHISAEATSIATEMQAEGLLAVTHKLSWSTGDRALRAGTVVKNVSGRELNLTMATSFCLSGLSPFSPSAPAGNLMVHRLRSAWSAEAKLVSELLEDLHLDQAWAPDPFTVERFGQVGTMPVRGFAPFVGVEDVSAGVTWAAQVAWSGSWQIELCRRDAGPLAQGPCPRGGLRYAGGAPHRCPRRRRRMLRAPGRIAEPHTPSPTAQRGRCPGHVQRVVHDLGERDPRLSGGNR